MCDCDTPPVGYDIDQLRLTGKFSHSPRDQRVLQFSTEYRDLELGNRVYIGASSRTNNTSSSCHATLCRELQHLRSGDRADQGAQSLHPLCLPSLGNVCRHELGKAENILIFQLGVQKSFEASKKVLFSQIAFGLNFSTLMDFRRYFVIFVLQILTGAVKDLVVECDPPSAPFKRWWTF